VNVKRNIVANFLGSGWSALMGLLFIPVYIRYLGIEAYALIGVFALLQAWFVMLDMGLSPTLNREMARFRAGVHTDQSIRDLVFCIETLYGVIAVCIAAAVILASGLLATEWLKPQKLPSESVTHALMLIGALIGVKWLSGLYSNAVSGLQHQVWLSGCAAFFATARGPGVIGVLAWISPRVEAFFAYQLAVAAIEAVVLRIKTGRLLPKPPLPPRFHWGALRHVWRYAAGVSAITFLALLLTQVDKLLLSRMLSLAEFGYYALAGSVVGVLYMMIAPINMAVSPRLAQLVASGDSNKVSDAYHSSAQVLTMAVVPAALVLCLFSDHVLLLWTRDVQLTAAIAPLVSLLIIGNLINGVLHVPYSLQLAHGVTRLPICVNAASVLVIVPAIYFVVPVYGAIGAATVWVVLNIGYLAIAVPLMHRTLLPSEMWRWYTQDIAGPALAVLVAACGVRLMAPVPDLGMPMTSVAVVGCAALLSMAAVVLATPLGRQQLRYHLAPAVQT
jgi:O-antigen/teichoic acid export membrane protein